MRYRGNAGTRVDVMCVDPGGWTMIFETPAIISGSANRRHPTSPSPGIRCANSRVIAVRVESDDDACSAAEAADATGELRNASDTVRHMVLLTNLPYKLGRVAPAVDQRHGIVYAPVVGYGCDDSEMDKLVALRVARECCINLNKPPR